MTPLFRSASTAPFDGLYRQHAAAVYRYARAVLGNHADAEDVTQQTFLNAYRALARGTKPRKAENWVFTIAHNEVRRHFRDTRAQRFEVELDAELADPTPEPSEPSVTDVLRALQHLTPNQRSALVMREFEGRSYAEIAEIMDVSQGALETLMFRARRTLAEALEDGLTCAEAELAVSRRLDGRLSRREARRLKKHVRECGVCKGFEVRQRRQRSLLKGLSVIPVPASLLVFRGEQAAAALGGGGAAVAAAAGGGSAGIAVKAAAVAAAVSVAGGVGYTAGTDRLPVVHRQESRASHAASAATPTSAAAVAVSRRVVGPSRRNVPRVQPSKRTDSGPRARTRARIKPNAAAKATRKAAKIAEPQQHTERATPPPEVGSEERATPAPKGPTRDTEPNDPNEPKELREPKAKELREPTKATKPREPTKATKPERPATPDPPVTTTQLPVPPPGLEKKLLEPKPEKTKLP